MSNLDLITDVLITNFNTNAEADKLTEEFRKRLGITTRYKVARLAIGRSLGESSVLPPILDSKGKPITGEILFGREEVLLWVGLLVTHLKEIEKSKEISLAMIQDAVKKHWSRGVNLLDEDWQQANEQEDRFIDILITRRALLPDGEDAIRFASDESRQPERQAKPIYISLGKEEDAGEDFKWLVNGTGYSPHVAVMGQSGSGKTRTLLNILHQINSQDKIPVLLLDLGKGDLASNKSLAQELKATVIKVPENPIPLDMFYGSTQSPAHASDIVLGFRDSFAKVMLSKAGARQMDKIREALKPLFNTRTLITLDDIKLKLKDYYEEAEEKTDSVISTINDLTERTIFTPTLSPNEFFEQSWIITFGNARDTVKNLATFMLMDSLNTYMKSLPESAQDGLGNRAIRTVLAIDEARHLLASKHNALSENIRLHRSKGLVVALSSQSPDDYEGTADDYLENIGLPICFKTNAKSNEILQNMFRGRPNFSVLANGVCMTLKNNKAIKVIAFR